MSGAAVNAQGVSRRPEKVAEKNAVGAKLRWRWTTLGEVVESMKNGIYKARSAYCDDGVACLRMYNIERGQIVWKDVKRMRLSKDEVREYGLQSGDLLVNRVNSRELVGKTAVIRPGLETCVFESKNIRVRLKTDVADPRFVSFALLANGQAHFTRNAQQVVGMASISQPQVAAFPLPLPSLDDQQRIVAEIEKQFTRLDAGVASLKRVQVALKRYRASVLKAACEGRLVPTEAQLARKENRSYESAAVLLEHILKERRAKWNGKSKYTEPAPADTADLPQLPVGWCWASAEQTCLAVASGSTPTADLLFSGNGEVPFIKVYNLTFGGALDFSVKPTFINRDTHTGQLARSKALPGDVLTNIVGPPLGKVSIVPDRFPEWNINQAIVLFRPTQAISNRLLAFWLRSEGILTRLGRTAKATAGQFNIQVTTCRKIALPLPPLAEQARIVAEVERRMSVIDEFETIVSESFQRVTRLRHSILQWAFGGGF
jgi:type I restriction enzyme S subunit